jgi:small subunit ribosomal protein S19e
MVSKVDVSNSDLIEKVAIELKAMPELRAPEWAAFAKTGAHTERPPQKEDWWHMRAAAVLRSVSERGPVGVNKLRTKFGGKRRRGHQPPEFRKGSGSIIRMVLQQLDEAGLTIKSDKGVHKGRIITAKGRSLLDKTAAGMVGRKPKAPGKHE